MSQNLQIPYFYDLNNAPLYKIDCTKFKKVYVWSKVLKLTNSLGQEMLISGQSANYSICIAASSGDVFDFLQVGFTSNNVNVVFIGNIGVE